MFDITTLAAADISTLELVGGDDAPLFDDKGTPANKAGESFAGSISVSPP